MFKFNLVLFLFFVSFGWGILPGWGQQLHFENVVQITGQNHVRERSTYDISDSTINPQLISIDRYNEQGNKIEAIEYYYGKRYLSKFVNAAWTNVYDTTRYTFSYNDKGWQLEQENHNYDKKQENQMYRYDAFGNVERWVTGRSYQLSHQSFFTYDDFGTVIENKDCWTDSCESQTLDHKYMKTTSQHYIKYNDKKLLEEDLVNYVDGMGGYVYEYIFNNKQQITNKKQYYVNSFFGLDHSIPTIKDVNNKTLYNEWKYVYNENGILIKETWIEHWTEVPYYHEFEYNEKGLISESVSSNEGVIKYTYDNKGLLQEELHYHVWDKAKVLTKRYKFVYVFK